METKKIDNLGKLNIKRFEPSLIIHSNYLFCFDATRNAENKFSIEKINLQQKSNTLIKSLVAQLIKRY